MRNLLVLAILSSTMISCATMKSWMGSEEAAPAAQQKEQDPLDMAGTESAATVAPQAYEHEEKAPPAESSGAELSNHSDPYVAEAASDIAAETQGAAAEENSGANDSPNLPQKTVNEEMAHSAPSWQGEPTPAIASVAPEAPQVYDNSPMPAKKGKKAAMASKKPAKKEKVAKKPKVDCKKVAKQGKKAKKPDVAFCKAEKKAAAKLAAKKPKVDCKKIAKLGKKAKKPDVAFCKAEAKKKKSRVASKGY